MRVYFSLFRIRLINGIQYRAVTVGAILTRFVWVLMELLAYIAIYRTAGTTLPMELSQTVSYVWMQQTLRTLFLVVFGDGEIYATIGDGGIAYELVRPADLYGRWYCQAVANRAVYTIVNGLPVLLVGFLFPKPYGMTLPAGAESFILFLLSVGLALGVVAAFVMLMYIVLFYTLAQRGIKVIVTALTTFLSGDLIPLPFFPEAIGNIAKLLPFASMQNTPLLIYSGTIAGREAFWGIALQVFWLIVLIFIGRFFMRHSLKRVVVQGG